MYHRGVPYIGFFIRKMFLIYEFKIYAPRVIHGMLNCTALTRADVTERSATAKSAPPSFGPIITSLINPSQFPLSSGFPYLKHTTQKNVSFYLFHCNIRHFDTKLKNIIFLLPKFRQIYLVIIY